MKKILLMAILFVLPFNTFASSLEEFFIKNSIGKKFKKSKGMMLVSKATESEYETFIDGYEVTLFTRGQKIISVSATKNFNVGDIAAEEDFRKYRFRILNYYAEKNNVDIKVYKNPGESWSVDGKSYGVECHTTQFAKEDQHFFAQYLDVSVQYTLGSKVWCDNRKDPLSEGWGRGGSGNVWIKMGTGNS